MPSVGYNRIDQRLLLHWPGGLCRLGLLAFSSTFLCCNWRDDIGIYKGPNISWPIENRRAKLDEWK
jgi:hypothetical protein